jgi:hypothetical protein
MATLLGVLLTIVVMAMEVNAQSIPNSAENVCPIKVGSTLPALTLYNLEGKEFDLKTAVSQKPTILIFYRGGW